MSAKESLAIGQLLSLLESRYAIRVLWALRDGHAQTFRLLQYGFGASPPQHPPFLQHQPFLWLQPMSLRD